MRVPLANLPEKKLIQHWWGTEEDGVCRGTGKQRRMRWSSQGDGPSVPHDLELAGGRATSAQEVELGGGRASSAPAAT
jgi:hypothetical protein